MVQNDDFQLIREYIAGDRLSFNKIVAKYRQKIYWHARRMVGNHIDADEVTQEVIIVLYEKLKNFKFKSSLFTWIYRITSTRSLNLIKRRKIKRFFSIDDVDYDSVSSDHDIMKDLDNKEKIDNLNAVLKELPVKQREVFVLRHFDELSYEEIAEITGKSVGGLKANYFHALKKVTELMNEE